MSNDKIRVAVIGTGNIGTDLCERLLKDAKFELVAFVGRRSTSAGLTRMQGRLSNLLDSGIESLEPLWAQLDGVFDATSASAHAEHWAIVQKHKKWIIDLTPSRIGKPIVPVLIDKSPSMKISHDFIANYSMVTCGGQSSAALIYAITKRAKSVEEVEISSSIASLSAGPATRNNIDEYIDSTENMATLITGCSAVKSILVLNPADPPVMMRTTVHVRAANFDLVQILQDSRDLVAKVKNYVPGYDLVVEPHLAGSGQISATVRVLGSGHYLPEYSGNLDIINSAAVETAKQHMYFSRLSRERIST
jgi:acetaldehyde dehydrogenase (acetylating)